MHIFCRLNLVCFSFQPLPELSCIPGLFLPGSTFSDCLMVLQFLRSFGKVLGLDINSNVLNLSDLQKGLLNIGDSAGKVQDLLVSMVSAAVCDPGIPAGHKVRVCHWNCSICPVELQMVAVHMCIHVEKQVHSYCASKTHHPHFKSDGRPSLHITLFLVTSPLSLEKVN